MKVAADIELKIKEHIELYLVGHNLPGLHLHTCWKLAAAARYPQICCDVGTSEKEISQFQLREMQQSIVLLYIKTSK